MAGIKIVNILKDDTFQDILELFRHTDASEVIFVLPKNGKVFRTEDQFAAFASESANSGKAISVLSNSPAATTWAHKYGFHVMPASKEAKPKATTKATLASSPPPADPDIQDFNEDAFQSDVVVGGGEQDEVKTQDVIEDEADPLHGMHVVDEDEEPVDDDKDGKVDEPTDEELTIGEGGGLASASAGVPDIRLAMAKAKAEPTPVAKPAPAARTDLDYIDEVWRQKAAKQQEAADAASPVVAKAPSGEAVPVHTGDEATPVVLVASQPSWLRRMWWKIAGSFSSASSRLPNVVAIPKSLALGILAASVIILATIVYLTTGSASVVITPVARALDAQLPVQASDTFSSVDATFNKIPGQLFEVSKSASATGTATGSREVASKARGKITVFNNFSSAPQTLIATTRFQSSGGLIFRTLQTITVPGSTVSNGKAVAGTVTVDVIADKPGTEYNIAPDTFTIPAFKEKGDADRYAKFTGQSTVAFTGGANGPSKVVTQADYDTAKEAATKAVTEQIKADFTQQASGMMLLDGIVPAVTEVKSTAQPDDAAATFTVTATATIKTVAFRQADLYTLLTEAIMQKEHLFIQPEKLDLKYSDISFKDDQGVLAFTVALKGTGYMPVDEQAIANDIKGMNSAQIRDYFAQKDGIESATVSLTPFWVRRVPTRLDRIHLQVRYDSQP